MVRLRAGRTRRALDHIQPVHLAGIGIAPLGEIPRVAREAGEARVQEIGVERENYVRIFQVVLRLHRLAERQLRAFEHVVAVHRLVHMPLGLRISLEQRTQLVGQRRRGYRRRQDANARALQSLLHAQRSAQRIDQITPGADIAQVGEGLRTIGIVHAQDRCLGENIRPAETRRMPVVAFNFGRAIKMALHQNRAGISAQRECGGEEQRPPGNHFFRLPDIRDDRLQRLLGAGGHAGHGQRRAHQLQESAT